MSGSSPSVGQGQYHHTALGLICLLHPARPWSCSHGWRPFTRWVSGDEVRGGEVGGQLDLQDQWAPKRPLKAIGTLR